MNPSNIIQSQLLELSLVEPKLSTLQLFFLYRPWTLQWIRSFSIGKACLYNAYRYRGTLGNSASEALSLKRRSLSQQVISSRRSEGDEGGSRRCCSQSSPVHAPDDVCFLFIEELYIIVLVLKRLGIFPFKHLCIISASWSVLSSGVMQMKQKSWMQRIMTSNLWVF